MFLGSWQAAYYLLVTSSPLDGSVRYTFFGETAGELVTWTSMSIRCWSTQFWALPKHQLKIHWTGFYEYVQTLCESDLVSPNQNKSLEKDLLSRPGFLIVNSSDNWLVGLSDRQHVWKCEGLCLLQFNAETNTLMLFLQNCVWLHNVLLIIIH